MPDFHICPTTNEDQEWVARLITDHWGDDLMVAHGETFIISQLPGFAAFEGDEPVGLVTYNITGGECEITSLDSLREGKGIGSALIEAVKSTAREAGCKRLFLITTNDNIEALRFYQRRGFVLAALRPRAVEKARIIKPQIPLIGNHGIPIRDEIELEIALENPE